MLLTLVPPSSPMSSPQIIAISVLPRSSLERPAISP